MPRFIPTIEKWMSTSPLAIDRGARLSEAHALMRKESIRHLPVLDGGALCGIVSLRDLHLIETLKDVDPDEVGVDEAMTPDPYTVSPDTPLDEVVTAMAAHKYGAAVVLKDHKVVGMFTTVDALAAFAELLHGRLAA